MSVEALTTAPTIAALTQPWEVGPLAAVFGSPPALPKPALDIEDVLETATCRPLGSQPTEAPHSVRRAFSATWNKDSFKRDRLPQRGRFSLVCQGFRSFCHGQERRRCLVVCCLLLRARLRNSP